MKTDFYICRNILEIRLKNKKMKFIDIKGEMADYILKKMGYDKFRLFNNRIDLTNEKDKIIFFSWENFGFQDEAVEDIQNFKNSNLVLNQIIKEFSDYEIDGVSRIGTKSTILYHINGKSIGTFREAFNRLFFNNQEQLFDGQDINILDNGLYAFEINIKGLKADLTLGIMTAEEIKKKYFKEKVYQNINKDGLFIDIDLFDDSYNFIGIDQMKRDIDSQIDSLWTVVMAVVNKIRGTINER